MHNLQPLALSLGFLWFPVLAAEQFIPVVNGTIGSNRTTTTVEMQNQSAMDATCEFEYRSPSRPENPLIARERVPAGKNLVSENFLSEIPTASTVRVRCSSSEVRVFSRIQPGSRAEGFGDGWLFRAVSATEDSRARIVSFSTRTNVVIAEVAGKRTDVAFVAKNKNGDPLVEKSYTLLPYGQRIIDLTDVLAEMPEAIVEFRVVNGDGALVAGKESREPTLSSVARRMSPDTRQRFEAHQARAVSATQADVRPSISEQLLVASFKAAAFREPATGLVYVRDRWYDPSTGTFVAPDRMGYRDSSNPYTFAGGDPVNKGDPTGMYQADMHAGLTYKIATLAGFNFAESELIARSNVGVDLNPATDPVANAAKGNWGPIFTHHFPIDPGASIVTPANATALRRMAAARTLTGLGAALHTFQDTFSHSNAYSGNIVGQATTEVGRRAISVAERSGKLKDPEHGIMHETFRKPTGLLDAREAAREADYTHLRPDLAWAAAQATLEQMLQFRMKYRGMSVSEADERRRRMVIAKSRFFDFFNARTIKQKKRTLDRLAGFTAAGLVPWDDVTLPKD